MDKLFTAVDTIVSKRIENLPYDKTITATITNIDYASEGAYIVDDGTTTFMAYSENTDYQLNQQVYVNVPQGDYQKNRIIIGKYFPNDDNKFKYNYVSPMNTFVNITGNLINTEDEYTLTANSEETAVLIQQSNVQLKDYDILGISGKFKSWLNDYNDIISGEYGIRIDIYSDQATSNSQGQKLFYSFYLSSSEMIGDPYNYDTYFLSEKTFDISGIKEINKIAVYFYQDQHFKSQKKGYIQPTDTANLFLKEPILAFGYDLSRITEDKVLLYSFNPDIYYSAATVDIIQNNIDIDFTKPEEERSFLNSYNTKDINLRWIHLLTEEEGTGTYNVSSSGISSTRAITIDEFDDIEEPFNIKWYKYNKIEDTTGIQYDEHAGEYWDELINEKNNFLINITPDIDKATEQYKAIVEYPSKELVEEQIELDLDVNEGLYDQKKAILNNLNEESKNNFLLFSELLDDTSGELLLQDIRSQVAGYKETGNYSDIEKLNLMIQHYLDNLSIKTKLQILKQDFPTYFEQTYITTFLNNLSYSNYETIVRDFFNQFQLDFQTQFLEIIKDYNTEEKELLTEYYNTYNQIQEIDAEIELYKNLELSKIQYYVSEPIIFNNSNPNIEIEKKINDSIKNLEIIVTDDLQGVYNIYENEGQIKNLNDAHILRTLEARYKKYDEDSLPIENGETIIWRIPLLNTMIERPEEGVEYSQYSEVPKEEVTGENYKEGCYYLYDTDNQQYIQILPISEDINYSAEATYYKRNNVSVREENGFMIITKTASATQDFRIKSFCQSSLTNNEIFCTVQKDDVEFNASINLSFSSVGNNGTDYTFYLEFFNNENNFALPIQGFTEEEKNEGKNKLNIRAKLFNDLHADITSTAGVDFNWEILNNTNIKYYPENTKASECYIKIKEDYNGATWKPEDFSHVIVKCQCTLPITLANDNSFYEIGEDGKSVVKSNQARDITLTAFLPIPVIKNKDLIAGYNGNSLISYDNSGTNPICYEGKFRIYDKNGSSIGEKENSQDIIKWEIYGITMPPEPEPGEEQIIQDPRPFYPQISQDGYLQIPAIYLMGDNTPISIHCKVNDIVEFILPLRITKRVYNNKVINSWDGSLTFNKNDGIILSTMMGAGYKDSNNRFNGVILGDIAATGQDDESDNIYYTGTGLYGYNEGEKSFGFNINGRAFLGKAGKGQILFDGNSGTIASLGALDINNIESGTHINLDTGQFYSVRGLNKVIIDPNDENQIFEIQCNYNDSASTLMSIGVDNYYLKSADNNLNFNLLNGNLTANKFSLSASNGTRSLYLSSVDSSSPFKVWKKDAIWPTNKYYTTITGDGYPFSIDWDGNLYVNNITIGNKIKTRYFYQQNGQIKSTETTIMGFGENSTLEYSNANTVTIYQRSGEYPGIVIGDNGLKALYLYNNKIELPVNSYIYAPLDWWDDGNGSIASTIDKLIGVSSKKNIVIGDNSSPASDRYWDVNVYGDKFHFNGSAVSVSSDRRLKTNFSEINNYKNFIMSLRPKKYAFKKHKELFHLGFIADEVFNSLSLLSQDDYGLYEKVSQNEDDSVDENNPNTYYECLAYDEFIAPHIALTQEHENEINKLKDKISILEDKIESLLKYIKESKED